MIPRRITGDHYEWWCGKCATWYISIAAHLRLTLHRGIRP